MNKKHMAIVGVVVIIVGVASFFGGESVANAQRAAARAGQAGQFAGAGFTRGGGRAGMQNGDTFAAGQIIAKDATSITLKLMNGGSQIIFLSDKTPVMKTVSGTLSDLTNGLEVTATGKSGSDGSLSASSIQIRPARIATSTASTQ